MSFGDAFGSAFTGPVPPSLDERMATVAVQLEAVVEGLARFLAGQGVPVAQPPAMAMSPVDMANTVVGLAGPASADDIAAAITTRLNPDIDAEGIGPALLAELKNISHRLIGVGAGQAYGSAGTAEIKNITIAETGLAQQSTLAGVATEATLNLVRRGITGDEQRLAYDVLNNLEYQGKAPNGTATTAATWTIQKLSYTGTLLTRVQQLTGVWDNRASLGW